MDNSGPSGQASLSDAGNGAERPLPPIPEPQLDLYSGGDEEPNQTASSPHTLANLGRGEGGESYQNRGQLSQSESHAQSGEVSPSDRNFFEVKGGESNSTHASEELAGPARQPETPSHLSRTSSDLNPPQNSNLPLPSDPSPQTENSSENAQVTPPDDDMLPSSNNGGPPGGPGRVRPITILPGTVNFSPYRGQENPQYQVLTGFDRVVLPRWEPDFEVTTCPICSSMFSMFNRKHHCRKCGKVVCAACSPHRITIPSEYIVRPPLGVGASPPRISRPLYDSMQSLTLGEDSIERGERVRLCNPCVPDPNTAPPQVSPPPYYTGSHPRNERPVRPEDVLPRFMEYRATAPSSNYSRPPANRTPSLPRFTGQADAVANLRGVQVANNPRMPNTASNDMSQRRADPAHLPSNQIIGADTIWNTPAHLSNMRSNLPRTYDWNPAAREEREQMERERSERRARGQALLANPTRAAPAVPPQSVPQPAPRRVIPEEDMCPVCGNEYTPRARANEAYKAMHVESCIAEQLTRGQSNSSAQSTAGAQASSQEPRTPIPTKRGMTKYTATARDAVPGEECQICLDDFLPGQNLALLTCFCKLHSQCILGWWTEGRHFGQCPTHDHGF
ncbi:hypothetical protein EG329_014435 [Mollisiaceae sp. DMI_Dod_QoI]|nr:hypothetical protein EG329_014435 [Helotiales sp. DMI_Dod_QoI]